jgi:hypothetical protein
MLFKRFHHGFGQFRAANNIAYGDTAVPLIMAVNGGDLIPVEKSRVAILIYHGYLTMTDCRVSKNQFVDHLLSLFPLRKKLVKDEFATAAFIRDSFAHVWEIFTPENFVRWLHDKPQFIRKVIERITDYNIELIKLMVDAGADVIVSNGDIAEKNGPMVSPKYFNEIFFPNMKKEVNAANNKGVKFIKHTDGNIMPIEVTPSKDHLIRLLRTNDLTYNIPRNRRPTTMLRSDPNPDSSLFFQS